MIVTHINPDLDCILATWFLKKFGGMKESPVEFIKFENSIPNHLKGATFVDIGKGELDHHHRDDFVSAAILVLEKLHLTDNNILYSLADIARKIDHGLFDDQSQGLLNLVNIISGLNKKYPKNPNKVMEICFECLDSIYLQEQEKIHFEEELRKATIFNTIWGKGIAVVTKNRSIRFYCHMKGYVVFVYVDPIKKYRGFVALGGKGVDFSSIFKKLKEKEPQAEWYLHFTKDLLICGSDKAANRYLSKLTLQEMVQLIEK